MALEKLIVDVVNPERKDLVVYYPGSAYDIVDPLIKTQGQKYVFVDLGDSTYGTFDQQLKRIKNDIQSDGKVRKCNKVSENLAVVTFTYQNRPRELVHHHKRDALKFKPPELKGGYDIYFSKGAGPLHEPYYMARMIKLMRPGGFFVSAGCDMISHCIFEEGERRSTPTNYDLKKLGFVNEGVFKENYMYGGREELGEYSLLRKVKQVDNPFEILMPTYFGLILKGAETFLAELKKNPKWDTGNSYEWREHIKKSVLELNKLAPLLEEKDSPKFKKRLMKVNVDVKSLDSYEDYLGSRFLSLIAKAILNLR